MLNVPVYNMTGDKVGDAEIDEALLGGEVNAPLLKQALVQYNANQRQGTVKTKGRSEVQGAKQKLYRQKGTGRARMGTIRTCVRRGGGMAFAKTPRDFRQSMPTKMRRRARNQAVLAKIQADQALIIDELKCDPPKTGPFAKMLTALQADQGCIIATNGIDANVYRSGRNIPRTEIMDVTMLSAGQILQRKKLVFTKDAFEKFKELAAAVPAKAATSAAEA